MNSKILGHEQWQGISVPGRDHWEYKVHGVGSEVNGLCILSRIWPATVNNVLLQGQKLKNLTTVPRT